LEEGLPSEIMAALAGQGHPVTMVTAYDHKLFGSGKVILKGRNGFYLGGRVH